MGDLGPHEEARRKKSTGKAKSAVCDLAFYSHRGSIRVLGEVLPQLPDLLSYTAEELEAIGSLETEYKTGIPPYYFSLIDPDDPNDPIRLQSVPSPLEAQNPSGYELEDPLEEDKDSPVPGLTHRYPDRALLVTTHVCSMYCRFCTRKRATMVRGGW